ncbi:TPA: hypothetical protein GXZ34_00690 [bacterium]|nr:hypothetical protein [bacterium]
MAYTLNISSVSPTTFTNTANQSIRINFSLSGSGLAFPGFSIDLYSSSSGGSVIKTLYYESMYDLVSGVSYMVSFADVTPGTYYVSVYYKVQGSPRRAITVTGASSGVNNITLNGTKITTNNLNNSKVLNETLNGNKVYE